MIPRIGKPPPLECYTQYEFPSYSVSHPPYISPLRIRSLARAYGWRELLEGGVNQSFDPTGRGKNLQSGLRAI